MSYISEIFDRANIQQIREFLLYGVECAEISDKSYKQRIEESSKTAIAMIQAKFPDMNEYEKVTAEVYRYASTVEDVYLEIGLQCGIALAVQFLKKPNA
ncbi:hypothetical protein [Lutispora saccharofermentans]|uniref:Uncharacterized protein n=1 Tax=Lutispora saccharofermentans TaxID=3024236 RepID=A0ABT1NAN3_9FIRM|nr:hypothetical protein [Lutispora saccharofermentans]MCQ1528314.1 hypothetical protein [Lutispora saccharofermentans]